MNNMVVLMKSNTITALPRNGLNKDLHYKCRERHNLNRAIFYSSSRDLRMSSNSFGVTTFLTAGKCLMFPVTR